MLPNLLLQLLFLVRESTFRNLHRGVKLRGSFALHRVGDVRIKV